MRAALEERVLAVFLERVRQQPGYEGDGQELEERLRSVQNRAVDPLDSWRRVFEDYHQVGAALRYQKHEPGAGGGKPFLREMLEPDSAFENEHHRKLRANRSLRDVEPNVNLYLR